MQQLQIPPELKKWLIWIASSIFLAWLSWPCIHSVIVKNRNIQQLSLGDWYNALNVLVAGFAFVGLITTLYLQSLQLKKQDEAIGKQEKEIDRVKGEAKRQQFESIFFQLLNTHRDVVNQMTYTYAFSVDKIGETVEGTVAFVALYEDFANLYKNKEGEYGDQLSREIDMIYKQFYTHSYSFVSHYFRNLYHTVKFIDEHKEITKDGNYADILKAQLSSGEVLILFYNCISAYGRTNFKDLVRNYLLIEHLEVYRLISDHQNKIQELYNIDPLRLEWYSVRDGDGG